MEVLVLGPLDVRADRASVPLGGGKQQVLLAVLALRAGAFVPRDTLVDALWPDAPPPSARHAIESYVSRARRVIKAAGADGGLTIESAGAGYRLQADAGQVDALRFEALAQAGHEAMRRGDAVAAAAELTAALALWRGPALGALADHPALRAEAAGLEEQRLHALEAWAEAELELGHHREITGRLRTECGHRPGRERLHELLILALYRAGGQSDALEVYQAVRGYLSDELGLEPGPALRALQAQVLQQDPVLDGPVAVAGTVATVATEGGTPFQLPDVLATTWRSPLVGRDGDLAALAATLEEAAAGPLQTVMLAGEPGIGKTRLCSELAQAAQASGAVVLYGRCDEEPILPHQPFVEGLGQYIAACPELELAEQLGPGGGELLRILPELSTRAPGLAAPVSDDPEGARFRLFDAIGRFVARAAEHRPLVLVLDDLHWADKPTLLLLRYLTRTAPPRGVMLLGTYRETEVDAGHPLSATLAELRGIDGFTDHSLRRLDEAAVAQLVKASAAEQSGRRIFEETDGNPFFVVEMLSHLRETGGTGLGLGVPDGVKDVIARRLARLDTDTNRALAVASIVGRDFELGVLDRMSDLGEDRLADVLEGAARAHVIEEVVGAVGHYTFSHALTRETVYGMLTNTRRALLHRRAGTALEARYVADLAPHQAELAHHFECAAGPDDLQRAITHRQAAGEQALALLAYEQAASHYRRAAALIEAIGVDGRQAQRCDLVIARGEAERRAGDPTYRVTLLEGARLASELGDGDRLARAALANNRELFSSAQGIDQERVAAVQAALAAQTSAESATRAELLALLAVELIAGPDWDLRRQLADDALDMARRVGDRRTLGVVLQRRFVALWGPQTLRDRRANADEAGEIAAELEDPMLAFAAAALGSIAAMEAGDLPRADELLEVVAPLVRQLGQPVLRWYEVVCHAKRTTVNGHPRDAERLAREAFEVGQEAGQPDVVAWYFLQTVAARLAGGRLAADDPDLPALFAIPGLSVPVSPEYTQSVSVGLQMDAMKAVTFSEIGRLDDAQRHFDQLMANDLRDRTHDFAALSIPAFAALTCAHLRDAPRAAILHAVMLPHRDQFVDSGAMWLGAATHYLARLEAVMGRPDDADASFAATVEQYMRLGADAWLARAQIDWAGALIGRAAPGDARRAGELLDGAVAIARGLELPGLVEMAAPLLTA